VSVCLCVCLLLLLFLLPAAVEAEGGRKRVFCKYLHVCVCVRACTFARLTCNAVRAVQY
jgi:hypothetical protein